MKLETVSHLMQNFFSSSILDFSPLLLYISQSFAMDWSLPCARTHFKL